MHPLENPTYDEALDYRNKYQKILSEMSRWPRGCDAWLKLDMDLRKAIPPGIYRHFKSSDESEKLYAIIGVSNSTEDDGIYTVQYASLYPPHAGRLAGRPLLGESGFLTPVKRETHSGARFVLVSMFSSVEVMKIISGESLI